MNSNLLNSTDFNKAVQNYFYLIDRDYPEKGSLKLVGDRYKLNRDQRTILYRGITSQEKANKRKERIIDKIENEIIVIDGYNVLFSLLNYLLGRVIFISNDDILRDAGSLHGKIRKEKLFNQALELLFHFLIENKPSEILVYLDSPVSHSLLHQRLIDVKMQEVDLNGECYLSKSADYYVKRQNIGIIATSDSAIIDSCGNSIIDIPRKILEKRAKNEFLDLKELIFNNGTE